MFATLAAFVALLCAALTTGAMFSVWLGDPSKLDAVSYVARQQDLIRALNVALPALGILSLVFTLLTAAAWGRDRGRLALLLVAAACFLGAGLVTRLGNQPINTVVMSWTAQQPPADWTSYRDAWWRWHVVRTAAGIAGLCLLIAATLQRTGGDA